MQGFEVEGISWGRGTALNPYTSSGGLRFRV